MACSCAPGQECQPLKPGCWGYSAPSYQSHLATIMRLASTLDQLASLVERMADTTPDDRDRVTSKKISQDAADILMDIVKLAQVR